MTRRRPQAARARSAAEEPDQLAAPAFAQATDRLRRRDPTLAERTRRPHATDLRQRKQEVVHFRRLRERRRPAKDLLDPNPPRGEPAKFDLLHVQRRNLLGGPIYEHELAA